MDMDDGLYAVIKTPVGARAVHIPSENMEIENLRKKLAENRKEADTKLAKAEEARMRQAAEYESRIAEIDREKQARLHELANRKAKNLAIIKRAILCFLVVSLFFLLFWFGQCKISVFLMITAVCLVHLAYYAGTWRLEVFQ